MTLATHLKNSSACQNDAFYLDLNYDCVLRIHALHMHTGRNGIIVAAYRLILYYDARFPLELNNRKGNYTKQTTFYPLPLRLMRMMMRLTIKQL